MPVLCLTFDNGPQLHFLLRGSRFSVVVVSFWRCVRADEDLCSVLPVPPYSCHQSFVPSSRLGPRQRGQGPVFPHCTVWPWVSFLCACVVRMEGKGCCPPRGFGQQPWQEKADGRLAVDFLSYRWGRLACFWTHGAFTASGIWKICKRRLTQHGKAFFLCMCVCFRVAYTCTYVIMTDTCTHGHISVLA